MPDTRTYDLATAYGRLYDQLFNVVEDAVRAGWGWNEFLHQAKHAWINVHEQRTERAKEEVKDA